MERDDAERSADVKTKTERTDDEAVETLEAKVHELEGALSESQSALRRSERERRLERSLQSAGAVDLETARLLAAQALEREEGVEDEAQAVEEIRRRKPFLFRQAPPAGFGAMGASEEDVPALSGAAKEAARTGDRNSLLRYLRMRREKCGAGR